MSGTYIERPMDQACDVELFNSDFATFFHLCFIFTVFGVLQLKSCACTAGFKLYFCSEYPFRCKFIIESKYETGDGYGIPFFVRVTVISSIEAVYT